MTTSKNSLNTAAFPVYVSNECEMPLGVYGCEILKRMPKNNPQKYWQLSFGGNLISAVSEREKELQDLKYILMGEMEQKFPRPKTEKFFETAKHLEIIDELAERIVIRETRKPF